MIFPLRLTIDVLDRQESFSDEVSIGVESPRYRVCATALDTENRRVVEYTFHSMRDHTREPYQDVGFLRFSPIDAEAKSLREVRDAINSVLGEENVMAGNDVMSGQEVLALAMSNPDAVHRSAGLMTKRQTWAAVLKLTRSLAERGSDVVSLLVLLAQQLANAEAGLPDGVAVRAEVDHLLGPEEEATKEPVVKERFAKIGDYHLLIDDDDYVVFRRWSIENRYSDSAYAFRKLLRRAGVLK